MSMFNHMDAFSEELLLHTLHYLYNSSTTNEFVPALLVCRRLNRIGTSILYRNVLIRNPSLVTSITSLVAHGHYVRSLSIRIQPCEPEMYTPDGANTYPRPVDPQGDIGTKGSPETHALWAALDAFTIDVIPCLQNLSTFSLTVERWRGGACPHGWWIRRSSSALVIRNLPRSVENLEVDLEMHEQPLSNDASSEHSCPFLRRLLPRLRHLRLRLTSLCHALLYDLDDDDASHCVHYSDDKVVKAPCLETLVVNASNGLDVMYPCGERDSHKTIKYRHHGAISPTTDLSWWTALCLRALHTGSFPKMSRCDVFSFKWDDYYPDELENDEDDEVDEDALSQGALSSDHHIQYSILARKTYRLPQKSVNAHGLLMLRTPTHEEVFGENYALEQKAEGPAWVETVQGLRFPAAFAAKGREEDEAYLWRDLDLQSNRKEFVREHGCTLEVWDEEEKVGHWIMDVEEEDGV